MAEHEEPNLPASRGRARPLGRIERAAAVVFGSASSLSGGYAVFETSNQAGSAALVLAGAAFLLIGVQGTRLIRFEGAGSSIEMDSAAEHLVEAAKREPEADRSEEIVEAAAKISPSVVTPSLPDPRSYEDDLHRALKRTSGRVTRDIIWDRSGRPLDFLVEFDGGRRALVEAKSRRYGAFTMSDVRNAIDQVEAVAGVGDAGLLIVTNAPLSGEVQDFNAQGGSERRPVEVINWNDERDDGILSRSIQRVAR
ncbi:hypothetical protein OHS32_32825 [Micromonospora chokoriensis]